MMLEKKDLSDLVPGLGVDMDHMLIYSNLVKSNDTPARDLQG